MTRRIALAILLTVWAILIAGCTTAYFAMRWVLIAQLDESIKMRAASVPELVRPMTSEGMRNASTSRDAHGDRYVIKNASGQTISPAAGGVAVSNVTILSGSFATVADGTRERSLNLSATAPGPDGKLIPVTVIFRSSAASLDSMLDRLALGFWVFGMLSGLLTALVALRVSRAALKPLHATADVIGTIDPQNLHRRIEAARLPPELVPMASRLNEMLERIERAYTQRQQFLANASHELRTPVAALVTTTEVSLRHPRTAEAYRQTLESCLCDARQLRQLVETLMEQCRADTLTHDEAEEEIDIVPVLNQCADQAQALAGEQQVRVTRTLPASFKLTTQPQRLRSVVTNLLSNAVEYNRPGGCVELIVQPNGRLLHLAVKDTGPGIGAEHIPHLFEPFYRADRARSGAAGHLGLGLSLVQSHCQALGGRIDVESTVGVGTTFKVDLPLDGG